MKDYNKIVVFGDIHGRSVWREIIEAEQPDLTVFLGDYVTSREGIGEGMQLQNLDDILQYKEQHAQQVVLLRGNHDCEAAGFEWGGCFPSFGEKMLFPLEKFEQLTQWAYRWGDVVFSHAGISNTFLAQKRLTVDELAQLSAFDDPRFGFCPADGGDCYGDTVTQTPTWIRPEALLTDMPQGLIQVVGHTTHEQVTMAQDPDGNKLWLCDALGSGSYLRIEDGKFVIGSYQALQQ